MNAMSKCTRRFSFQNLQLSGRDSIDKYLEERIMDRICEQAQVLICNWESYREELMNEKLLSEPKNSRQKSFMARAQNAQPELKNYLSKGCDAIRHSMPKLLRQYPLSALTQN